MELKAIPKNDHLVTRIKNDSSKRRQFVDYGGYTSNTLSVDSGVPRGWVKEPLLFLLFINNCAEHVSAGA